MSRQSELPMSFLSWQVKLRAWTMAKQHGAPHAGVAPIVSVRRPGTALGVSNHSIICGLLPRRELLAAKTAEFRALYDRLSPEGARGLYDAGIAYLTSYYADARDFDASSVTTLLHAKSPVVEALRAEPACSLLFYVFDLRDRSEIGAFRCWQLDCRAALHERGDVFDNVYWHNALFHGMEDDRVAVQFFHQRAWDTQFASFSALSS